MNTTEPIRIVVPPEGIALSALLALTGLTYKQVTPLLGDELGAPRDYTMPPRAAGLVFTLGGARRLVSIFGLMIDVVDTAPPVHTPAPSPSPVPVLAVNAPEVTTDAHGRPRGPWWKREAST